MRPCHADLLGLTAEAFVDAASGCGVPEAEALETYRQALRVGAAAPSWARLGSLPLARREEDAGTIKFLLGLEGGRETESVIIPGQGTGGQSRNTLCVSSQVGCARGCTFCETAQMGLVANLAAEHIVAQWYAARFALGEPIRNVVYMGMGEPMDNLDAVLQSVRVLTDDNGARIAPSRVTISTVGRLAGIDRLTALSDTPPFRQVRLAVSINAPTDAIRDELMPINRSAPLGALMETMRRWTAAAARRRVLIEYVVIPGVNDAAEHADALHGYLGDLPCTVNVIPYNPRRQSPWPAPADAVVDAFAARLHAHGCQVRRRRTRGRNAMAACGQLGNAETKRRNGEEGEG